jgi:trimeric autotransporter adhesin
MSLDERLRDGLASLDALDERAPDRILPDVVHRGRRLRWARRLAAGAVTLAAAVAAVVIAPKALDALRSSEDGRPAGPYETHSVITTVAGNGTASSYGDGGPAREAEIEYPVDLAFDGVGNLYILEHGPTPRVRKVDASGQITTVVGPEATGEAGELDLATTFSPTGLAVDGQGNVYLGGGDGPDIDEMVIRVDPTGQVSIFAGTGQRGFSGDGGPATAAKLANVWDVAADGGGNMYISAGSRIRKVDRSGIITTIAGTGTRGFSGDGGPAVKAHLDHVTGVAVDTNGNVYFVDYRNGRIRRIETRGITTTIAGPGEGRACFSGDGGPATEASLCGPEHLWADAEGNVYLADTGNHRIRLIDTDGIIRTVTGSGIDGYSGDGGPALQASLSEPSSVAVGPDGALYIADSANNRVRRVIL